GGMEDGGPLWARGDLGNALLAIDPDSEEVERIDLAGSPHWLAVSHTAGKVFASLKATDFVARRRSRSTQAAGPDPYPALGRRPRARAGRRDALRGGASESRVSRHRCAQPSPTRHGDDRRRAGHRQSVAPRAGVARWPLPAGVVDLRPSSRRRASSRSPRLRPQSPPWASVLVPTARAFTCAATTMRWSSSSNYPAVACRAPLRPGRAASSSSRTSDGGAPRVTL